MKGKTREILEIYVEKARILKQYGFEEHVQQTGLNWRGKRIEGDSWEFEFDLPDEKERDAFLLTFRFFIQKNEPISFHNLLDLANDPDLSHECKDGFINACKIYFKYINSSSEYSVNLFDGHPTRFDMVDAILYGSIAHANESKRAKLNRWTQDGIRENVLFQEFTRILMTVLRIINYVSDLCEKELKR